MQLLQIFNCLFQQIPHSNAQISPLPQHTYPVTHRHITPTKSLLKPCLKDLLLTYQDILSQHVHNSISKTLQICKDW